MAEHESHKVEPFGIERLSTFTDGVFAIVMTLLILEVQVPILTHTGDLSHALIAMWPVFLSYVASFINLGIYWVGQYNQFHYIRMTDRVAIWQQLLFLLFVSFVPFSTAFLGHYPAEQISYLVYGANVTLIGLISYRQWCYATLHHRLVRHSIPKNLVRYVKYRILFAPVVCCFAMAASAFSIPLSLVLYLIIPLYYVWPRNVDPNWKQEARPHDDEPEDEVL
jgi:uncharacterized membrane protein